MKSQALGKVGACCFEMFHTELALGLLLGDFRAFGLSNIFGLLRPGSRVSTLGLKTSLRLRKRCDTWMCS